ncbi:MAG: hypothetical protein GX443_05270 [Deltaproteobacteria bacterium]|nr:hypothetical protein [Deltaproteobacteria bacterium]
MQVRTFTAPHIHKALEQVKREMGPDAIILANKQVAISPTECHVEVTAAIDREEPAASLRDRQVDRELDIRSDLREIKSFLSMLISSKDHLTQLRSRQPLAEIYHALLTRGLDEKQVYLLLNRAVESLNQDTADATVMVDAFCRQLLGKVKLSRPFHHLASNHGRAPAFSFVGPTGVGKTTTLAKIAAHLKIKRRLDLGIISVDTYRIGAVDQLKTYANILEVPFLVAQNRGEFLHSMEHFGHHDLVLIDTTGKNYLQRQHVQDLQNLFGDLPNMHHFLVLSSTAKDEDLKQTIHHFRGMQIHSLIFTKIDETINHGSMMNQLLRFPHPLSYLGTGQRVPEDLEAATSKRLLSFLVPTKSQLHGKG